MRRWATLSILGLVVALGCAAGGWAAATSGDQVPDDPNPDAAAFAEGFGISEADVESQTSLQDAMDTIPFRKLDKGFAEAGSQMGPDFELWYRSALEPNDALREAMREAGVLEYVRFERVPLSIKDLMAKARALGADLDEASIPVGVSIDTALGGVVLHPQARTEAADDAAHAPAEELTERADLPYVWGDPPPEPVLGVRSDASGPRRGPRGPGG